jgi:hypothetical protein
LFDEEFKREKERMRRMAEIEEMKEEINEKSLIEKIVKAELNGQLLVGVSIISLISSFLVACACGLYFLRLD